MFLPLFGQDWRPKTCKITRLHCQRNNQETPPGPGEGLSVKGIHTSGIMALCPFLRMVINSILWLLVQDSFSTLCLMMTPCSDGGCCGGASTVIAGSSTELGVIIF